MEPAVLDSCASTTYARGGPPLAVRRTLNRLALTTVRLAARTFARNAVSGGFSFCSVGSFHLGLAVAFAAAGWLSAAESLPVAYPIGEPPLAAQLSGIDPEWNFSFRSGGKVRVLAAADLAYWGRFHDTEAGPQIVLADGGIVRADVLLLDDKQIVLGDASGLARGMWDDSSLPRA